MATRGRVKTVLVPGEDTENKQPVTESVPSEETETETVAAPAPEKQQADIPVAVTPKKIKKAVLTEKGWICPVADSQSIPVARGQ